MCVLKQVLMETYYRIILSFDLWRIDVDAQMRGVVGGGDNISGINIS